MKRLTEEEKAARDLEKRMRILKAAVKRSSGHIVQATRDGVVSQETFAFTTTMEDLGQFVPKRQVFFD